MTQTASPRLSNFPVTLFASVMGLSGLALAWRKAEQMHSFRFDIHMPLAVLSALVFIAIALVYIVKIARYPQAVKAEFVHPVTANFFPAISISLVLLAALALEFSRPLADSLFTMGALLHLVLTVRTFDSWLFDVRHHNQHLTPAWFIPVVGNVLMPVAAVPLGLDQIGWFFYSIGIVYWLVLFTILLHRLFFLDPMPPKLMATLFILIAPPSVAFISYIKLNGYVDNFAQLLYGIALFITLFLLIEVVRLRKLPFFISWWAYSFPLAAISIASLVYYEQMLYVPVYWIAISLLALASVVVAGLFFRTLFAIDRKQICIEG